MVHAKGAGAFGTFEVTNDISKYTSALVFSSVGKKTPITVRFSQVAGNMGSADTVRDVRGFSIKFHTSDGIWDLVGNNTPIFFIRDPTLFPHFIHTQKRNPVTNLRDWDAYWDFMSLRPETTYQFMILYSDRGIPDGYRYMHGFGSHTFSLINKEGKLTYCKFIFNSNQGFKSLDVKKARDLQGRDPDYAVRDLYNTIARGDFPSWNFYIQVMTPEEASKSKFDPFDLTKVWPKDQFPLLKVGKFTLNKNPENYFAEVEQLAFSPANFIPGIGPSPDKILQARIFSYRDTQVYRLGVNHQQLPVNAPFRTRNYQRDGQSTFDNQGGAPNYYPNSFNGPKPSEYNLSKIAPALHVSGKIDRYESGNEDNFSQAKEFYLKELNYAERGRLVENIAEDLKNAAEFIQNRVIQVFTQVNENFGIQIAEKLKQIPEADL